MVLEFVTKFVWSPMVVVDQLMNLPVFRLYSLPVPWTTLPWILYVLGWSRVRLDKDMFVLELLVG